MEDITIIINSIFYDLIKAFNFSKVESDEKSILFKNEFCYLFIGHHMGEVYVHIRKEKEGRVISPLMWAVVTNKLDYKKISPVNRFESNTKSIEILKYNFVVEKTLISLFCLDLLNGDFSQLNYYDKNIESINNKIFKFFQKN